MKHEPIEFRIFFFNIIYIMRINEEQLARHLVYSVTVLPLIEKQNY